MGKEKESADPNAPAKKGRGRPTGSKTDPSKLKDVSELKNPKRRLEGESTGGEGAKKKRKTDGKGLDESLHAESTTTTNGHVNGHMHMDVDMEDAGVGASRDFAEESTRRIAEYET